MTSSQRGQIAMKLDVALVGVGQQKRGVPTQPRFWLLRFSRNSLYWEFDPDEDMTPKEVFATRSLKIDDSPVGDETSRFILPGDVVVYYDADERCFHGMAFVYDTGWDCGTHAFMVSPMLPFDPPCLVKGPVSADLLEHLETDQGNRLARLAMADAFSVLQSAGISQKTFWDQHGEFCEQVRFYQAHKSSPAK